MDINMRLVVQYDHGIDIIFLLTTSGGIYLQLENSSYICMFNSFSSSE